MKKSSVWCRKTREDLIEILQTHVWSHVPKSLRGKKLRRKKREQILGYGAEGA